MLKLESCRLVAHLPKRRLSNSVRFKLGAFIVTLALSASSYAFRQDDNVQSVYFSQPLQVQRVEGFSKVIFAPNKYPFIEGQGTHFDYRGPANGYWTASWWVPNPREKNELIWQTERCPAKMRTVFSFVGASAATPPEFARAPQARLYVDNEYALTFDLGIKNDGIWKERDWELRYESKRVEWPYDGYWRQIQMTGNSGLYRLTVPARVIHAGKPCEIKVELLPFPQWPRTWFMVKDRKDTLQPEHLDEELHQLRRDVSRLQEQVFILAANEYPELLGREKFKNQLVYTNGWRHTHPADAAKLRNRDWLLSFREAEEHVAPNGEIVILRSHDEGKTWGERQVLRIPDGDQREACMLELPDGRLMMNVYVFRGYDKNGIEHTDGPLSRSYQHARMYTVFSTDEGKTWSEPVYLDTSKWWFTDVMGPASAPILLPDGTILIVLTAYKDTLDIHNATVVLSSKDGTHWDLRGVVAQDPEGKFAEGFEEGSIVRTRSGKLIVAMRNQGPGQFIWIATSNDEGRTWSKVKPSPMIGHPPELLLLDSGAVLCTYGYRPPGSGDPEIVGGAHGDPGGIRAMLSYDEGETWEADHEIIIRNDLLNADIGYPISLLRTDGTMVTLYYMNLFGRYSIDETIWTLPALPTN